MRNAAAVFAEMASIVGEGGRALLVFDPAGGLMMCGVVPAGDSAGGTAGVRIVWRRPGLSDTIAEALSDAGRKACDGDSPDALTSSFVHEVRLPGGTYHCLVWRRTPRLIVAGDGHVASALLGAAALLDSFELVVASDGSFEADRFPPGTAHVRLDHWSDIARHVRGDDCVVVATRGHLHDLEVVRALLKGDPPRYLGMIGSRRKVGVVRSALEEEGVEPARLRSFFAPIGIDMAAETPAEIAVSVLAEVVHFLRTGEPHPMSLCMRFHRAENSRDASS